MASPFTLYVSAISSSFGATQSSTPIVAVINMEDCEAIHKPSNSRSEYCELALSATSVLGWNSLVEYEYMLLLVILVTRWLGGGLEC
jgi:hypothetical protein